MNILWCGNRLINKKENRYTHLIYFANLTDLYLLNKEGVHLYNPKTNKLITLNENNKVNDIKRIFNIEANHYIMIAISSDMQRLIKGIEYSIMKQFNNKELLENTKLAHIDKKNILEEAAIIEAGSVVNNIMLSASAHNIAHYHVNILNKANITKTTLNIRKNHSTPFILIPIAQKKDTKTNKDKEKQLSQVYKKELEIKDNFPNQQMENSKKDQTDDKNKKIIKKKETSKETSIEEILESLEPQKNTSESEEDFLKTLIDETLEDKKTKNKKKTEKLKTNKTKKQNIQN